MCRFRITTLSLAVLAIATAGQFVMLLGAALMLFKVYKRAASTIDTLEHEQIRPLLMRVNALIASGLVLFVLTFAVNFAARAIVARGNRRS